MEQKVDCKTCLSLHPEASSICELYNRINKYGCIKDDLDEVSSLCYGIINNTASFLYEISFDDAIHSLFAFDYLLKTGFFSVGDGFVNNNAPNDYNGLLFTRIIAGCGCCRHIVDFYRILLNTIDPTYKTMFIRGYESAFIKDGNFGNLNTIDKLLMLKNYLKVQCSDRGKKYSKINYGNHACLAVDDHFNDRVLIMDPTNLRVFRFNGTQKSDVVGKSGTFTICGSRLNNEDLGQWQTIHTLNQYSNNGHVSEEELLDAYYLVQKMMRENADLMESLKKENKRYADECFSLLYARKSLHR